MRLSNPVGRRPVARAAGLVAILIVLAMGCRENGEAREARWLVFDIPASRQAGAINVLQYQGFEHCETTSVTFLELTLEGRRLQFLRDPDGVIRTEPLPGRFEVVSALPQDGLWTGWRNGDLELWLSSDAAYAFVGSGESWERWVAPPYEVGCD